MKLTPQVVETATYEGRSYVTKSGRKRWSRHVLWDDSLPGFGLRVTSTNRKSYFVSYRADGRKRTKTLGSADELQLDEARRQAAEILDSVGEEPPRKASENPVAAGVETVAQLADAYLEHYLKANVPSWFADQRLMRTHIKPAMGGRRSPRSSRGTWPGSEAAVGGTDEGTGAAGAGAPRQPGADGDGSGGGITTVVEAVPPAATGGAPPSAGAAPSTGATSAVTATVREEPPNLAAAEAAVRSWAAAWSEPRVDDDLAAYSSQFEVPAGLERGEWAAQRRRRVLRPAWIRLTLGPLWGTLVDGDRVQISFEQSYETDGYGDRVVKTLELIRENGSWKIAAERVG